MERSPRTFSGFIGALALLLILAAALLPAAQPAGAQDPNWPYRAYLPQVARYDPPTPTPIPTATQTPTKTPTALPATPAPGGLQWDSRLDERMAVFIPAKVQPGQWYWKLVSGVWFDLYEPRPMGVGDHDIAIDVRKDGQRQVGKQVKVSWFTDGACSAAVNIFEAGRANAPLNECDDYKLVEAKPGEAYAGSYPMYHTTGTYRVAVADGSPSDAVDGLGMGTIQSPYIKYHTSYGFVWQWTQAGDGANTPPTASPTPPATATPSGSYQFNTAVWESCRSQAGGTWFSGTVKLQGQPANGYRIVYSSSPDGAWITQPTISGPHYGYESWAPGYYSHLIGVGKPLAGDWYVWIVDNSNKRISAIARWTSTGASDTSCNDATVNFDS